MSTNSFDAKATLSVGGRDVEIFRLDALQSRFDVARLPYSLKILLENLLRTEGNGAVTAADIEALASWDAKAEPSREIAFTPARVVMQDFTGVPGHRRPRGDARRDGGARRRPGEDRAARPRRARHRPLGAGRRVRQRRRRGDQRRPRVRAQPRALPVPEVGPAGLRDLQGRPAGHRHRPPGQPRVPLARRLRRRSQRPRLPRHARRDRLAHDDDQRPGAARLGRRRDRGRGGDARPADPDADPAGRRHAPRRRAARGRDRDGPRPHRDRAAARDRRRRQVRRVLRARHLAPAARRPRDARQHEPRVRLDLRDLPDRRGDDPLPGVHRAPGRAGRPRRGVREGAGSLARRARRGADLLQHGRPRSRHRRAVARGPAAPAGPRPAAPLAGHVPRGADGLHRADGRRGGRGRHARAHRGPRDARRRDADRAGARPRRDRRDHELHEHLQPVGDAGRRPARAQRAGTRPDHAAVGEDVAGAGLEGRDRLPRPRRADGRSSTRSGSTSSATAARRASATPGRFRTRSRRPSTSTT